MKIKMQLVWGLVLCLVGVAYADGDKHSEPSYSDLVTLENKSVVSYEGFKINVSWDGTEPSVSIYQEQTNVKTKDVTTRPIVDVKSDASQTEVAKTNSELLAIQSFSPSKIVAVYKDDKGDIEQFNFLDDKGKVRGSEWRNIHSGFAVQNALYTTDGKLLTLVFYYHLKVNERFGSLYPNPVTTSTLANAIKILGNFDLDDVNGSKDFAIKLLHRVLTKSGFGDNDHEDEKY